MRPWLSGIVAAVVAAATASSANAACDAPAPYPGDDQPAAAVAEWMADGARGAGLPRELPVMGALVASGLKNLRAGDADEAGYFGMRRSIWNGGAYAGFPDRPELQLQWFVDQALLVRTRRLAAGVPDPALDESAWGEWIADVLRPADQLRGRYALRLAEAHELVGPPCPSPGSGPAPAPPPQSRRRTSDRRRHGSWSPAVSARCGVARSSSRSRVRERPASPRRPPPSGCPAPSARHR